MTEQSVATNDKQMSCASSADQPLDMTYKVSPEKSPKISCDKSPEKGLKISPKKTPKKSPTKVMSDLEKEQILGEPNHLLKVINIVNECNDWPKEDIPFRRHVIEEVMNGYKQIDEKAIELCFDIAITYGFIVAKQSPQIGYELNSRNELDLSHDWFCFDCDVLVDKRSQQFLKCCNCFRVFHRKCIEFYEQSINIYHCLYCNRVNEWERDGFVGKVDQKRVNVLIRYSIDFIENKMKKEKIGFDFNQNQLIFIYKSMNLFLMREKAVKYVYNSFSELENDLYLFIHNLKISSLNSKDFSVLKNYLTQNIEEMLLCIDCYEKSNDKTLHESKEDWFCEPCDPPHEAVFVKIKYHPIWPAKVLKRGENKANVIFFDPKVSRMEVNISDVFDINDKNFWKRFENNKKFIRVKEMVIKYQQNVGKELKFLSKTFLSKEKAINKQMSANITNAIENVVKRVNEEERTGGIKIKAQNRKQNSIKKGRKPIICENIIPENPLKNDCNNPLNSVDSSQSLLVTIPLPTVIETKPKLKDKLCSKEVKRRSVRLSENRKINFEVKEQNNSEVVAKESIESKVIEDMETMGDNVCKPMEVDISQEIEQNNTTEDNKTEELPQTRSSCISEPIADIKPLETNDTNLNLSSNPNLIQNELKPNETQSHSVMNILNETFGDDFDENCQQFERKVNELMTIKEQTIGISFMKERLILIEYYHKQQMNALEQQLIETRKQLTETQKLLTEIRIELKDCKTKNWCVVCQQSAQFYCCLRYYCSVKCQNEDWSRGHFSQCLTLNSGENLFKDK